MLTGNSMNPQRSLTTSTHPVPKNRVSKYPLASIFFPMWKIERPFIRSKPVKYSMNSVLKDVDYGIILSKMVRRYRAGILLSEFLRYVIMAAVASR